MGKVETMKQERVKLNETENLELPMNTEEKHDDHRHDVVDEDEDELPN